MPPGDPWRCRGQRDGCVMTRGPRSRSRPTSRFSPPVLLRTPGPRTLAVAVELSASPAPVPMSTRTADAIGDRGGEAPAAARATTDLVHLVAMLPQDASGRSPWSRRTRYASLNETGRRPEACGWPRPLERLRSGSGERCEPRNVAPPVNSAVGAGPRGSSRPARAARSRRATPRTGRQSGPTTPAVPGDHASAIIHACLGHHARIGWQIVPISPWFDSPRRALALRVAL